MLLGGGSPSPRCCHSSMRSRTVGSPVPCSGLEGVIQVITAPRPAASVKNTAEADTDKGGERRGYHNLALRRCRLCRTEPWKLPQYLAALQQNTPLGSAGWLHQNRRNCGLNHLAGTCRSCRTYWTSSHHPRVPPLQLRCTLHRI